MKIYDVVPGLEFDEKVDLEKSPAWFLDAIHSVPPWTPMFGWFWVNFCRHGMQYGAEKLSLPLSKAGTGDSKTVADISPLISSPMRRR